MNVRENRHAGLVGRLIALAGAMFVFGFLLVPLYDVLCAVTGIGGRPSDEPAVVIAPQPDEDRTVVVEFVATVNDYGPWEFRPSVASLKVHPGQLYDTSFLARNLTQRHLIGQAVPSVAPGTAAQHFVKTECFCFTAQAFEPGESRDMGVTFMIAPELPAHVDRVTLSYSLFVNQQVAAGTTSASGT